MNPPRCDGACYGLIVEYARHCGHADLLRRADRSGDQLTGKREIPQLALILLVGVGNEVRHGDPATVWLRIRSALLPAGPPTAL